MISSINANIDTLAVPSIFDIQQELESEYISSYIQYLNHIDHSFIQKALIEMLRDHQFTASEILNQHLYYIFLQKIRTNPTLSHLKTDLKYMPDSKTLQVTPEFSIDISNILTQLIAQLEQFSNNKRYPIHFQETIDDYETTWILNASSNQFRRAEHITEIENIFTRIKSDMLLLSTQYPELNHVNLVIDIQFAPHHKIAFRRLGRFIHVEREQNYRSKSKTDLPRHFITIELILPDSIFDHPEKAIEEIQKEEKRVMELLLQAVLSPELLKPYPVSPSELQYHDSRPITEFSGSLQRNISYEFDSIIKELLSHFPEIKSLFPNQQSEAENQLAWVRGFFKSGIQELELKRNEIIKKSKSNMTKEQFEYILKYYERLASNEMLAIVYQRHSDPNIGFNEYIQLIQTQIIDNPDSPILFKLTAQIHIERIQQLIHKSDYINERFQSLLDSSDVIRRMFQTNPPYTTLLIGDVAHGFNHFLDVMNIIRHMIFGSEKNRSLRKMITRLREELTKDPSILPNLRNDFHAKRLLALLSTQTTDQDQWYQLAVTTWAEYIPHDFVPANINQLDWDALLLASMFHDITTLHYAKDRKLHHLAGAKNAFLFIRDHQELFRQLWENQLGSKLSDEEFKQKIKKLQQKTMFLIIRHDGLWKLTLEKLQQDIEKYKKRTFAKIERLKSRAFGYHDFGPLQDLKYLPKDLVDFNEFITELNILIRDGFFIDDAQAAFEAEVFFSADKMDGLELKDRILLLDSADSRLFFDDKLPMSQRMKVYSSDYKYHYNDGIDRLGIGLYGLLYKLNPDLYEYSVGSDYFKAYYSPEVQTEQYIEGLTISISNKNQLLKAIQTSYDVVNHILQQTQFGSSIEIIYDANGELLDPNKHKLWSVGTKHRDSLIFVRQRLLDEIKKLNNLLQTPMDIPTSPMDEFRNAFERARRSGNLILNIHPGIPVSIIYQLRHKLQKNLQLAIDGLPEKNKYRILDSETFDTIIQENISFDESIPTVIIFDPNEPREKIRRLQARFPTITFLVQSESSFAYLMQQIEEFSKTNQPQFIIQLGHKNRYLLRFFTKNSYASIDIYRWNLGNLSIFNLKQHIDELNSYFLDQAA